MVTVQVTVMTLTAGLIGGLALALARAYGPRWLARGATAYITLMRAVPDMVALFLFFFVIGEVVPLSPLIAAVLALAAISSAYQAEVIRGAIGSVGMGQMIAARAVGMSQSRAIRSVILPQALRHALPPWSNIASSAVKNSSLVYALGIPELLRQAQYVSARTLEPFTAFGLAAVIYLTLVASMNWLLRRLERRLAIPNVGETRARGAHARSGAT